MGNYKYYMGVDVGDKGGIAVINNQSKAVAVIKNGIGFSDNLGKLSNMLDGLGSDDLFCVCEQVNGQPSDGASRAFNFGYNTACLHNAMTASQIPFELVIPRKWQTYFGMKRNTKGGETYEAYKRRLKSKAIQLFPDVNVTLWNCDALLIAEYCKRNF